MSTYYTPRPELFEICEYDGTNIDEVQEFLGSNYTVITTDNIRLIVILSNGSTITGYGVGLPLAVRVPYSDGASTPQRILMDPNTENIPNPRQHLVKYDSLYVAPPEQTI